MLTKEMLKNKVIIGAAGVVVLVIILTAAMNLITTEKRGGPKAGQNQQVQPEPQPENKMTDAEIARRIMEERLQERLSSRSREDLIPTEKKEEPKAEQNQQVQAAPQLENKITDAEVARRIMEERRQERLSSRSREAGSSREGFDKWLNDMTTAYEQNDMEKMGQLLKEMQETRERLRERRSTYINRRRDLRGRGERERIGPYEIEERAPEQVEGPTDKP